MVPGGESGGWEERAFALCFARERGTSIRLSLIKSWPTNHDFFQPQYASHFELMQAIRSYAVRANKASHEFLIAHVE